MNLVNDGICIAPTVNDAEDHQKKRTKKWLAKEMQRLQGLADIRMRAAEDALKASVRAHRVEMVIKAV